MKRETNTSRKKHLIVLPASLFVFLLAFAIFGWGTHSKLSLYHVDRQSRTSAPVAKLLSQRERAAKASAEVAVQPTDLQTSLLAAHVILLPRFTASRRWHREQSPPLQRPSVLRGASLLRPPPLLG